MTPGRVAAALAALVAAATLLWATGGAGDTPRALAPATVADALAAVEGLPRTDRLALGYDRAAFGSGWADFDRDGCDTRAEVLMRDLQREKVRPVPCLVLSGHYRDPYTGVGGEAVATVLDVDHVVSLADAWRTGANRWTAARRVAFANDPTNLAAASASVNRSKGDRGPDEWSPPDPAARCVYAARYVATKARYDLAVTDGQRAALTRVLGGCS